MKEVFDQCVGFFPGIGAVFPLSGGTWLVLIFFTVLPV